MMWLSCEDTCTGEMASRLLVLGARPFGITPGGGCRALFITLLQLATMVRIVSDSSWETLLRKKVLKKSFSKRKRRYNCMEDEMRDWCLYRHEPHVLRIYSLMW